MAPSTALDSLAEIPVGTDLYAFLSLSDGPGSTPAQIKKAYRQTSIKYHPDKVKPTPENLASFHLLQVALAVLSDEEAKSKYDTGREARYRRQQEAAAMEGKRRQMREDLERREEIKIVDGVAGQKRTFSQRDTNIQRIAEENRRKMEEKIRARKLQAQMDAARLRAEEIKQDNTTSSASPNRNEAPTGGKDEVVFVHTRASTTDLSDTSTRSLKLRWIKPDDNVDWDDAAIRARLAPIEGEVESIIRLKDKKRKIEGRKIILCTAVAVFGSRGTAQRVVQQRERLGAFESVDWLVTDQDEEPS